MMYILLYTLLPDYGVFSWATICDAMMHVLKDSIIQKLSELLTKVILSESQLL